MIRVGGESWGWSATAWESQEVSKRGGGGEVSRSATHMQRQKRYAKEHGAAWVNGAPTVAESAQPSVGMWTYLIRSGSNSSLQGPKIFFLNCTTEGNHTQLLLADGGNCPIRNISIEDATMVISVPDAYQCYKWDNQTSYERNLFLNLSSFPPYRFSDTRNKLTVLGCDTYAIMSDQDGTFGSGCISYCKQNVLFANETACSGLGCCQTSIPKGLKTLNIRLKSFGQYESVRQFNPCGLGFVVDSNSFNISERKLPSYEDINNTTELALDWMVEWDVTCEKARSNQLDYACRDNTDCKDFANGSGYRCVCKPGYSGNPYNLTHGCQGN
ncbi:hypothetical protein NL676_013531 [Syzygium grande]|nr:hypothetical protein NL676_013531 [Syzygium grande]